MARSLNKFAGGAVADVWIRAARDRVGCEWALLATILHDPAAGLELSDRACVDATWFTEPEFQTIYLAAQVCRTSGFGRGVGKLLGVSADRLRVYGLAKRALMDGGRWDEGSRQWFGPMWSDESLSALFDAEFTVQFVRPRARLLDVLATRQREAADHIRYAWRILAGETGAVA